MKAKPPGWPAPRLPTQRYATGTRQRRRGSAGRNPAQRGRRLASSLAEMAGLPGGPHRPDSPIPPAQTRLGEVFQASKHFGFALSQGNQCRTLAGEILKAAERLWAALTLATASSHTALQAHRLREAATAPDRE